MFKEGITLSVPRLLFSCCPNTVVGAVGQSIIFALDGHAFRTFTAHVLQEHPEVAPRFGRRAVLVVKVAVVTRFSAPLPHLAPNVVCP